MTAAQPLLVRVASGDASAAKACVERFGGLVWALARRHTPTSVDAEDAAQEIFVDLWRSATRFDPARSSEQGFVAMIARRRLIDLARRRSSRAAEALVDDPSAEASASGEERVQAKAELGLVDRALRELPDNERHVLELVTYEGLTQQQVAERLDMPLGTVKTVARRGLMRIRQIVGAQRKEEVQS